MYHDALKIKGREMKKTILLVTALILIFSLCETGDSYAVSDKKLAKLARKTEEAIAEAQTSLTEWKTADLIAPPEAEKILEKARKAQEAGSCKEAYKLAEEALKISSNKGAWKLAQKTKETIAQAQSYINLWEKEDYTPPLQAKETLKRAKGAYKAYNNEEAYQLARQSLKIASDKALKKQAQKAKGAIAEAEAGIARCESAGYPVSEAKEILKEARRANKRGGYKKAHELAKISFKVSSKKLRKYAKIDAKDAGKLIKKAEKGMIKWESVFQISSPKAKGSLEKARLAYQAGNYGKAYKLAYDSLVIQKQAVWTEKYIRKVAIYISKWELAGYEAPRKRRLLVAAREAQRVGEHQKAYQLASKAMDILQREARGEPTEFEVDFYLKPRVNLNEYKKCVVREFKDDPQTPGSGRIVTDLVSTALTEKGHQIVTNKEEAQAVVSGILTSFGVYEGQYEVYAGAGYGQGTLPLAKVELTLQFKDAKTDSIIWLGRSKHEEVLKEALVRLGIDLVEQAPPPEKEGLKAKMIRELTPGMPGPVPGPAGMGPGPQIPTKGAPSGMPGPGPRPGMGPRPPIPRMVTPKARSAIKPGPVPERIGPLTKTVIEPELIPEKVGPVAREVIDAILDKLPKIK